jgi:hypothetical protein
MSSRANNNLKVTKRNLGLGLFIFKQSLTSNKDAYTVKKTKNDFNPRNKIAPPGFGGISQMRAGNLL